MRRKLPLLLGATFMAFAVTACEGPEGPRGMVGPEGPPGQNALNTCSDCHHDDATIVAIEQQFAMSPHGFGTFEIRGPDYAGGSCAACHTSQGYVAMATGEDADWGAGAASMTCRTCHQIHTDFVGADYALYAPSETMFRLTDNSIDMGSEGANLCSSCHQARIRDPWPATTTFGEGTFDITSGHFGPHYSTQANVLAGQIGFLFGDAQEGQIYERHADLGCNGCHMASPGFTTTPGGEGGHTWQPAAATCNDCHQLGADVGNDFNYRGRPAEIYAELYDIGFCLDATGVMHIDGVPPAPSADLGFVHGGAVFDYHPQQGTYDEALVAAFITWAVLVEDGSWGTHNPGYVLEQVAGLDTVLDTNLAGTYPECDLVP